jgi:hypothetical protein
MPFLKIGCPKPQAIVDTNRPDLSQVENPMGFEQVQVERVLRRLTIVFKIVCDSIPLGTLFIEDFLTCAKTCASLQSLLRCNSNSFSIRALFSGICY